MDQNSKLQFLADSIAKAKVVMDKVEDGKYVPKPAAPVHESVNPEQLISEAEAQRQRNTLKNASTSKMPQAILQSFMDNPIVDPSTGGIDSLVEQVQKKAPPRVQEVAQHQPQQMVPATTPVVIQQPTMDIQLIEYIIKKTVETTLEEVQKKSAIDENFQIKIGEKVFGGKLTALTESTKKK